MPMHDDLGRKFRLDVFANGVVMIRNQGSPLDGALPVFSTDTHEQAESLRTQHCKLARDGSGIYRLNEPPADVDDLDRVSTLFRTSYATMKGR